MLCIELLKGDNFEFFPWLEDELFLELPKQGVQFIIETGRGLKNNHVSWIEDSYLALLSSVTFFCFGQMFAVSRKSKVSHEMHYGEGVSVEWRGVLPRYCSLVAVMIAICIVTVGRASEA